MDRSLLSPSQTVRDDEIQRMTPEELIQRLKWSESERIRLISEHENSSKDISRKSQRHLSEIRSLKETNDEMQKQSKELRDLCCFLDDDRQKGRKLAREWQKFGRYTSNVMNTELSSFQDMLKSLEEKQKVLVQENMDLKEIVAMLDQGRTSKRSSVCSNCSNSLSSEENGPISSRGSRGQTPVVDDQTKAYIHRLEDRIRRLEDEKRHRSMPPRQNGPMRDERMSNHIPGPNRASSAQPPPYQSRNYGRDPLSHPENGPSLPSQSRNYRSPPQSHPENGPPPPSQPRNYGPPPASHPENGPHGSHSGNRYPDMVNALKVLEVHDHIDKRAASSRDDTKLDDNQKAIVREMCNVVWRKLGDNPGQPSNNTMPNNYHGPAQGHPTPHPRYSAGDPPPVNRQPPPRHAGSTSSLDKKGL